MSSVVLLQLFFGQKLTLIRESWRKNPKRGTQKFTDKGKVVVHGTHYMEPKCFLEDSESESNFESASDKISFWSKGASLFFIQSIVYTISRSIDFNNIHSNSFNEILPTFSVIAKKVDFLFFTKKL